MTFSAAHRLFNPDFDEEKNSEIFGCCANPSGHGHNYVLEVTVSGPVDTETGMIINLRNMKEIIQKEIISKVDHKNLNIDVDFMKGVIPTAENFGNKIWGILDKSFGAGLLEKIILYESENNWVEISRHAGGVH
jgi:6-pyruvoyltetrahydropterin/6-carboxytetrahydropterin synthase